MEHYNDTVKTYCELVNDSTHIKLIEDIQETANQVYKGLQDKDKHDKDKDDKDSVDGASGSVTDVIIDTAIDVFIKAIQKISIKIINKMLSLTTSK